jgi:hypothetical protein
MACAERRRRLKTPGPSAAMCPVEPFNTAFATLKQKKSHLEQKTCTIVAKTILT